jgi:hypothetical protein
VGSYPLECPLEAVSYPLGLRAAWPSRGLPLMPKPVRCPVEPAFSVGSNQGAKESELLPNEPERNLDNRAKLGVPFSQKVPIVISDFSTCGLAGTGLTAPPRLTLSRVNANA